MESQATSYEPIVAAVTAALGAQRSVEITNWLLVALIVAMVVIGFVLAVMLVKIERIEHQTNSLIAQLLSATRKLALIEGEANFKAANKQADDKGGAG